MSSSFRIQKLIEVLHRLRGGNMLIGFGCQARVGKDTAAEYLISKYGGVRVSFAQPLYDCQTYIQNRCGLPMEKDRKLLQWLGTEWGREKDPNIWVNIALDKIRSLRHQNPNVNIYITDLRFPNEFDAIRKAGGITVRILRPEKGDICGGSTTHLSEIGLIDKPLGEWDHIIENIGTLDEFHEKLDNLICDSKPSWIDCNWMDI